MRPTDPDDVSPSTTPVLPSAAEPGTNTFHSGDDGPAPPTVSGTDPDATSRGGRPVVYALGMFGKYELLEAFPGGMGIVYMARDTELGRVVALKKLFPDNRPRPDEIRRFLREAQVVARLLHPHIIPIHDFNEIDGERYFTTDFIATGSLSDHRGRFYADARATAALIEKAARAVHYAHTQGVIHRDLKPGNILLTATDEPLVSDFGLAKMLDADAEITAAGTVLGTPAYMSPEQARGTIASLDPRSDVWALGVILYELLTGARPFPGSTREEVTPLILHEEPAAPHDRRPTLDPRLDAVVLTCLQKDPADRYPTAEALADDLKRWLDDQPVAARLPIRDAPEPAKPGPRRLTRRAWLAGAAGATTVGMLAYAGYRLFPRGDERETPEEEDARNRIEVELRRDEVGAKLIAENGQPRWRKVLVGPCTETEQDGFYTIRAKVPTLVELLPAPSVDEYTFSAEVWHREGESGAVGIYIARARHDLPRTDIHWFFALTFADQGRKAHVQQGPDGRDWTVATFAANCQRGGHQPLSRRDEEEKVEKLYPPPADPAGEWRSLRIDVDAGNKLEAFWGAPPNSKAMGGLPGVRLFNFSRQLTQQAVGETAPEFLPRRGLGLYLEEGVAWFRRVTICRLKP